MIEILRWKSAPKERKEQIMRRSALGITDVLPKIVPWIERIKTEGDTALIEYIREFDDPTFSQDQLRVSSEEIKAAYKQIAPETLEAMRRQVLLSRTFQEKQRDPTEMRLQEVVSGVLAGKRITAIDSAGLYVPAGSAPLPIVMQILGTSAKVAGVRRIVACFPPQGRLPEMLVAADLAGVDELYAVGGVAAIAAMAYGTDTIKPVTHIAGPGRIYVQAAKSLVRDDVAIDMIAGPSEVLIVADKAANPTYVAADLLAQAEHDPNAASVLVTWDEQLAESTKQEVNRLFRQLSRMDILSDSLKRYSAIVIVESQEDAIEFSNEYSPEHLELMVEDPMALMPRFRNAGAIFLGAYAPVPVGDYATGSNHTLPTGIGSRAYSPISVRTFQKETEVQYLTKDGLSDLREIVERISDVEGLDAHKLAVQLRFSSP